MAKGKGNKENTVTVVTRLAEPVAEEFGVEIWDVRFEKEGASWYLRIFLDKDGGVTIDDCENVSRKLDKILDDADPISQSYILEVSSPGVERELVKPEHFTKFLGTEVQVRFIRPIEGVRDFTGVLQSFQDGRVTLLLEDDIEMEFGLDETAYVRVKDDLGGLL